MHHRRPAANTTDPVVVARAGTQVSAGRATRPAAAMAAAANGAPMVVWYPATTNKRTTRHLGTALT